MKLIWNFAVMEYHSLAMYRLDFFMRLFGISAGMYAAYWLWTTLYDQQPGGFPVSLAQMITYGLLAMILNVLFDIASEVRWYIQHQVRTGALQMDLLRPLNFHLYVLLQSGGQVILAALTIGLLGIAIAVLFLGLQPPASLAHGLLFLLSLIPAFLVSFGLSFLVGLVSVYTIQASQISWVFYSTVYLLSGQFVPVWIFPPALQRVVALLPFHSMIGVPASIYIGRLSLADAGANLALQVIWAVVLLALGQFVWQHAYTRLTVQGG